MFAATSCAAMPAPSLMPLKRERFMCRGQVHVSRYDIHTTSHAGLFWRLSLVVLVMMSAHSQVRRSTRRQLHILRKKSVGGAKALAHSSGSGSAVEQRRPGDRLGGIPSSSLSTTPKQQQEQRQHLSPTAAAAAASNSGAAPAPKDALASELWAWLGGVGSGRSCSAERPKRSSQRSGGGGEWRGAFYNRECRAVANRV